MLMDLTMDIMGDDPFYLLIIDTILNNKGPFFKKTLHVKKA